jgi:hypothetical protein
MMMGNESHALIHGVGTVDLKLTSEKIVQLKNVQHVCLCFLQQQTTRW